MNRELPRPYFAYLLRMWQEPGGTITRVILKDVHMGDQHGFDSLDELIQFLQHQASDTHHGISAG